MRYLLIVLPLLAFFFDSVFAAIKNNAVPVDGASNPLSPRAALIRYWNKEIQNDVPKSPFLLSKASPLTVIELATFSKLATSNALGTRLPEFCRSAKLFCFPDMAPSLEKHVGNSNFAEYDQKNFTNYGTTAAGGSDSFKNYSIGYGPQNDFRRYSRDAAGRKDSFLSYGENANVNDQSFTSYAAGATGGSSKFTTYSRDSNDPDVRFTSYAAGGNGRSQSFSAYAVEDNTGGETFTSYGKNGNAAPNEFTSYGNSSNGNNPTFTNYGETGNGANDTFKFYGTESNDPTSTFKNYGTHGNAGVDTFTTYREQSNVGDDSFQSYAKDSHNGEAKFTNYGKSFNEGSDRFTGYGVGAQDPKVDFTVYGAGRSFQTYSKSGATFSQYSNSSQDMKKTGKKWKVEAGKFFREKMLKKGTIMAMPDIADKMPARAFLPRSISSKLPFSSSKVENIKEIFNVRNESAMEKIIVDALRECERAPSAGETKRCVSSAEDMIDFATSVLGRNIAVRTTANTRGSKGEILVGEVKGINGLDVTKSVSCHQSIYPYLLYYCHSVPKVRVYEADILDPSTSAKINHGVAICHVDTSSWSATHGAFLALGGGPGRIEVCHWIFENDMAWTVAD